MRSADYARAAQARLDDLVATQLEQIEAAGRLVADALAAGGRVWLAPTSHTVHLEATHRAGGLVAAHILHDPAAIGPSDAVVIATSAGTWREPVETALVAHARGARVVAMTQLDFERDPRLRRDHPSGRLLSECADVVIDLGGPYGDGEQSLAGVPFLPTSGATSVVALWMVVAAAADALEARGLRPLSLASVLLPGAAERNDALIAEYSRNGIGCRPAVGSDDAA